MYPEIVNTVKNLIESKYGEKDYFEWKHILLKNAETGIYSLSYGWKEPKENADEILEYADKFVDVVFKFEIRDSSKD